MKYAGLILFAFLIYLDSQAQWTVSSSNDAYNTNPSGKIGIGTSTPQSKLEVAAGNVTVSFTNNDHFDGNRIPMIGSTFPGLTDFGVGISTLVESAGGNKYGMQFITRESYNINPSPKMTISGDGKIGIATTLPTYNLDIATSGDFQGIQLLHNSGRWTRFYSSLPAFAFNGITALNDAGIIFGNTGGVVNNGFVIAPHLGATSGLRVDKNGNVGIGASDTKGYKLAIAGKVVAEELTVKLQANWPDYVFEPTYTLPSLDSVQVYINQNKHLSEIPSAREIETNGVNVGEMNMLLLKKVEELTLYMLEQQKQIQLQQTEITQVKQQLKIIKPVN